MNLSKFIVVISGFFCFWAHAQEERSLYLQAENFNSSGALLPLNTDEAKIVAEKWRKNLSLKSPELKNQFRADSYMEYDMRAIGGTYSYYYGVTLYNYISYLITEKNLYSEEFQSINCTYEQINMNLVVEQCALPSRKKPAITKGFQQTPPVYTYSEIQKDSQGFFIKGSKVYITK